MRCAADTASPTPTPKPPLLLLLHMQHTERHVYEQEREREDTYSRASASHAAKRTTTTTATALCLYTQEYSTSVARDAERRPVARVHTHNNVALLMNLVVAVAATYGQMHPCPRIAILTLYIILREIKVYRDSNACIRRAAIRQRVYKLGSISVHTINYRLFNYTHTHVRVCKGSIRGAARSVIYIYRKHGGVCAALYTCLGGSLSKKLSTYCTRSLLQAQGAENGFKGSTSV
ncbi:unnamed protein product, partial [Trichogramma brassicae]